MATEILPIIALRNKVLLPGSLMRLFIGRERSVKLVRSRLWDDRRGSLRKNAPLVGIFTRREHQEDDTAQTDQNDNEEASEGAVADVAGADAGAGGGAGRAGDAVRDHATEEAMEAAAAAVEERDVHEIGVAARVTQLKKAEKGQNFEFTLVVEGVRRVRMLPPNLAAGEAPTAGTEAGFLAARTAPVPDEGSGGDVRVRALASALQESTRTLLDTLKKGAGASEGGKLGKETATLIARTKDYLGALSKQAPAEFADVLVSNLDVGVEEKLRVLAETRLERRLELAIDAVRSQIEVVLMARRINSRVEGSMNEARKEVYLRQQLRAIQRELGEMRGGSGDGADSDEEEQDEAQALADAIEKADMPDAARSIAKRELRRMRKMQPAQPEYSVISNYLELLAALPWTAVSEDRLDPAAAMAQLDADHFGLHKVKRRIVEYVAVRNLKDDLRGPLLCLVGPPGVGKTSLGQSVATALGRKFVRLALGGVRDEAEIRGHRRTYIGAMAGSLMQALRRCGTKNPVVLLDEIDKLGSDYRGDPSAALLEVLDPEQNSTFVDHYVNTAFDLSNVLFIATANGTSTIPAPLLDRMELLQLPGYTTLEKLQIARRYLVPKQLGAHGISEQQLDMPDSTLEALMGGWTREAGVRVLEQKIAATCRHAAVKVVEWNAAHAPPSATPEQDEAEADSTTQAAAATAATAASADAQSDEDVDSAPEEGADDVAESREPTEPFPQLHLVPDDLVAVLGPSKFEHEEAMQALPVGVSTGMAWTEAGGELLFVEASRSPGGRGQLITTGKLGEVMTESITLALSWIRAHAADVAAIIAAAPQSQSELQLVPRLAHRSSATHETGQQQLTLAQLEESLRGASEQDRKHDLHVHFPAGATPKDGPSAGVAVTVALVSLLTGRPARHDVSMTGEVSLRGLVLPVGGVKEKILAAHRGGIKHIILPARNEQDLDELPPEVKGALEFSPVTHVEEALSLAFAPVPPPTQSQSEPQMGSRDDGADPVSPIDVPRPGAIVSHAHSSDCASGSGSDRCAPMLVGHSNL